MQRKISSTTIMTLLSDIKDRTVKENMRIMVSFNKEKSIHEADFGDNDYGMFEVNVGVKELYEKDKFPIDEAIAPIVGLCHEVYGHGYQVSKEFQKKTALSQVLALSYYACKGSAAYYEGVPKNWEQYANQPYEIAAWYSGIRAAHQYLTAVWGEQQAATAINAYALNEFTDEKWTEDYENKDIDIILKAIDRKFQSKIHEHRPYYRQDSVAIDDVVCQYAKMYGDNQLPLLAEATGNGLRQDQMMAAMYMACYHHRSDELLAQPVFSRIDLDRKRLAGLYNFRPPTLPPARIANTHLDQLESPYWLTDDILKQLEDDSDNQVL